jgi:hypothetical protein
MRPEEQLQRSVIDLLRLYEARGLLLVCHVGNGGRRTRAEAGVMKAMGVRAGVSDLLIWADGGRCFGVELKAGSGKLSPAQTFWHATVTALGHRVYVVRSLDEMEAVLRAEGVPVVGTLDAARLNWAVGEHQRQGRAVPHRAAGRREGAGDGEPSAKPMSSVPSARSTGES